MLQSLNDAEVGEGRIAGAGPRNLLVRGAMARRILGPIDPRPGNSAGQHNWRVTVARDESRPAEWQVRVGAGCVNDQVAVIRYQANDPRWQMATINPPPSTLNSPLDRPLIDPDRPLLLATAPSIDGRFPGSFRRVSDHQRPKFFRTREMWECDLYTTTVSVTGFRSTLDDVLLEIPILPTLPTLVGVLAELAFREIIASIGIADRIGIRPLRPPYRVQLGPQPLILDGSEVFRLADLWLLRSHPRPPFDDQLFVQQQAFWSLQSFAILEDAGLLQILPILQADPVGNLTAQRIFELLLDQAKVRWWTK